MAITALTPGQLKDYVCKADVRPPEDHADHVDWKPTTWRIKTLDSRVMGKLKDKTTKITVDPNNPDAEIGTQVAQHDLYMDLCTFGLAEPDNFMDSKGKEVKYETKRTNLGGKGYEVCTPEFIGRVPSNVIAELGEQILNYNEASADEKND